MSRSYSRGYPEKLLGIQLVEGGSACLYIPMTALVHGIFLISRLLITKGAGLVSLHVKKKRRFSLMVKDSLCQRDKRRREGVRKGVSRRNYKSFSFYVLYLG